MHKVGGHMVHKVVHKVLRGPTYAREFVETAIYVYIYIYIYIYQRA